MAYGTPKILASEILEHILAAIKTKLQQQGEFSNGLSYYGYNCRFAVDIELTARGEQDIKVRGDSLAGELPVDEGKAGTEPPPVKQTVATTGNVSKGKQKERKK